MNVIFPVQVILPDSDNVENIMTSIIASLRFVIWLIALRVLGFLLTISLFDW